MRLRQKAWFLLAALILLGSLQAAAQKTVVRADRVTWSSNLVDEVVLFVSGPEGISAERTFAPGETIELLVSDLAPAAQTDSRDSAEAAPDGHYTWELRPRTSGASPVGRIGLLTIRGGRIVGYRSGLEKLRMPGLRPPGERLR